MSYLYYNGSQSTCKVWLSKNLRKNLYININVPRQCDFKDKAYKSTNSISRTSKILEKNY